jgi:hypothetical protein
MSYREKIAWLYLVAMAITFGPYFVLVATDPPPEGVLPNLPQLWLLAAAAVAQMVLLGCGHLVLRRTAPEEARLPLDERDRAIKKRSVECAYYALIVGMILVGCVMPFTAGGWKIVNAAIFMIVVAELVHHGIVAWSYRRQSG